MFRFEEVYYAWNGAFWAQVAHERETSAQATVSLAGVERFIAGCVTDGINDNLPELERNLRSNSYRY